MFKRIGALAMILAGSMAVFTPAVAQAADFRDHGRYDRRDWREHDRWDHRGYRPIYYDRFGRPCYR